jgi:hypothetical protein
MAKPMLMMNTDYRVYIVDPEGDPGSAIDVTDSVMHFASLIGDVRGLVRKTIGLGPAGEKTVFVQEGKTMAEQG